jgi:hypothetical protein
MADRAVRRATPRGLTSRAAAGIIPCEGLCYAPDRRRDDAQKIILCGEITLDVSRYEAEQIAEKFNGRIVAGEPITLYAALHE